MKTTVARMRQNMHDPDAYADLDVELHLLIASATHNSMMYHLVKSIRDSLKDTILEGLRHRFTDEEFESVQARHDELVTELERGDPERAGRAMALHFDVAVKLISDGDPPAN
jgi:DNA-binding FadR family transcriptional regulator